VRSKFSILKNECGSLHLKIGHLLSELDVFEEEILKVIDVDSDCSDVNLDVALFDPRDQLRFNVGRHSRKDAARF
jgi:hypothetical protein